MKKWKRSALLAGLGLALCGAGFLVSPAQAAKPECSVENLPPQKRSYNSNTHANPLGTAIAEAKAGDTLQVVGMCRGNFVIDKSLTLRGRAAATQIDTLDGNGTGTVLSVHGGPTSADAITVQISNLTIANGDVGISRSGYPSSNAFTNVTLTDSTVSDNTGYGIKDTAFSGDVTCKGTLRLDRSSVRDNGGGGILLGYLCGPYTLDNSTVSGNEGVGIDSPDFLNSFTDVTLSGSTVSANDTGIIMRRSLGALTIRDSSVSNNRGLGIFYGARNSLRALTVDNSVISGNERGGIEVIPVTSASTTATITGSTISGNSTSGDGAGISLFLAPGTLVLTRSVVSSNTALGNGGGIYSPNSRVFLSDSIVSGNSAGGSGGGIYMGTGSGLIGLLSLAASTISGNTASVAGGGIFAGSGTSVTLDAASSACGNSPDDWQGCSR
jgi:predicted outer membrane repeat protein